MGVLVNVGAILLFGTLGLVFKAAIPEEFNQRIMHGIALCVLALGIMGIVDAKNPMVMILSVVLGGIIGEILKLEERMDRLVEKLEKKVQGFRGVENISEGFITATMLFCVGSMAIVGSLESGLLNDHSTLYAKSVLDAITSLLLASSLGAGVVLSSVPVLLYEGILTILASSMAPYLSDVVIGEVVVVGSLLLIGLALNLLNLTELKIINYIPALILPVLFVQFL